MSGLSGMSGVNGKNSAKVLAPGLRGIPGGALRNITKTDGGVCYHGRKSYKVLKNNFLLFCYYPVHK